MIRLPSRRRSSRPRRILIVDTSDESREATMAQLLREGYEVIATDSVGAACALVCMAEPQLVHIKLSAFPGKSLGSLGRVLSRRRDIRVLGLVSQFSADAPPFAWVVRLPHGDALAFGVQSSHPN
jgi:DNA-binding NtrC family response regulator